MPKNPDYPKINDIPLPVVHVDEPMDLDALAQRLAEENMAPEAMIEAAIYLRRQKEKADALSQCIDVLTDRLKDFYASLPPEKREARRVKVGMATYVEPGEKREIIDRDKVVESLTPEQLRVTYKPDLKAMQTILKPDDFNRLTRVVQTSPRVTLRDNRASNEWDELDF